MTAFLDRRKQSVSYGHLPPGLAGDLAYRRFCIPKLSTRRSSDHGMLTERARFHLRNARWERVPTLEGDVQAYIFEPEDGPARGSVLIAHGWTSEASFMAVIAEQLRRAGFRAVAFDQPGHGKSTQERASLIDCARASLGVAEALGPFQYAVTHSMGGLALLMIGEGAAPIARPYPFEKYVLVSSPNQFGLVVEEFAQELDLSAMATRVFGRHIERIAHRPVARFSAANLLRATGRPALVLHSRDDREVLFRNAEEIAAACPMATLQPLEGLGHRNVLFAPPVIRATVSYLTGG